MILQEIEEKKVDFDQEILKIENKLNALINDNQSKQMFLDKLNSDVYSFTFKI